MSHKQAHSADVAAEVRALRSQIAQKDVSGFPSSNQHTRVSIPDYQGRNRFPERQAIFSQSNSRPRNSF
jgi:hypothetical protein